MIPPPLRPPDGGWRRIEADVAALAGRWAEISYDISLFDPLERPRVLWRGGGEEVMVVGAAPVMGRGAWIGRVPAFAREGWILPFQRMEGQPPARLRLRSVAPVRAPVLFARAAARRPGLALLALRSLLSGDKVRTDSRLRAALRALAPAHARAWLRSRSRPLDPDGLERPSPGSMPRLVVLAGEATDAAGAEVRRPPPGTALSVAIADLDANDLVVLLPAGAALAPAAAAILREASVRRPADLFYADEISPAGRLRLKPDWSPILAESLDLIGPAFCARAGFLRARFGAAAFDALPSLRPDPDDVVRHVRRLLFVVEGIVEASPTPALPAAPAGEPNPRASLVIPTRDQPDMLSACLSSLRETQGIEIIVVDNASRDPAALDFLAQEQAAGRVRVLRDEGPFNFSHLCNTGAALARAPLLVFLNDDVEVLSPDWLDLMAMWAVRPDVGAVGAKLLYPGGRLQHGGVTLGMGGRAGHAERLESADAAGLFGRMNVPHELSAVTGACLAVEAAKFAAVGGFDATNLPVDLNDVDLCLRLSERGWRCVMEPRARLIHHESASRGDTERGTVRYAEEIAWFRRRWEMQIGDDPYFHPALSLATTTPALD